MTFNTLFRISSYLSVFCGFLSLWLSGTFGLTVSGLFIAVIVGAWFLEGSRWQISERLGTFLIVAALPGYYLAFRFDLIVFATSETMVAGILARLILSLTCIKLLQKKSDRDWVFLYLMAFFEVLLAAGLSISTSYFLSFLFYILVMVSTVLLFEMKKTGQTVAKSFAAAGKELDEKHADAFPKRRLPVAALILIVCIAGLATPMFFLLPRVGGAGIGAASGGVQTAGFSDTVRLGGIGTIQQNDEVVMRVRLEDRENRPKDIHWRGLALDTFDGQVWSKSNPAKEPRAKGERDLIQVDYATGRDSLVLQTVYLEPLDTPILFGLPRVVGVQGGFPYLYRDHSGAITFPRSGDRISYKALSDVAEPEAADLRRDNRAYSKEFENYLQLPEGLDDRVADLAAQIVRGSGNRYDAARAMEAYLQTQFGYTLEQKAGGADPLADFLFNVREGHCEYFATGMAIMLRTQGIATRVVNGFQQGEYNETADVFVVKQRNAHSWVEVYFPEEEAWVTFDPTPFAGQNLTGTSAGLTQRFNKYLEALEMFWIQYFVAFDSQEQRSLFTNIRRGVSEYNSNASSWTGRLQLWFTEWWKNIRGDKGFDASISSIAWSAVYIGGAIVLFAVIMLALRKIVKLKVWRLLLHRYYRDRNVSIVEFYDRLQFVLASKGLVRKPHQTPLEFAFAVNIPEAVSITVKYNGVRFGKEHLSSAEIEVIESWLKDLEASDNIESQ